MSNIGFETKKIEFKKSTGELKELFLFQQKNN